VAVEAEAVTVEALAEQVALVLSVLNIQMEEQLLLGLV
jgi:hypothetical protein